MNTNDTRECVLCNPQCHICGGRIPDNEMPVFDQDEDGETVSVSHRTCQPIHSV